MPSTWFQMREMWVVRIFQKAPSKTEVIGYGLAFAVALISTAASGVSSVKLAMINLVSVLDNGWIVLINVAPVLLLLSSWILVLCNDAKDRPPGLSVMPFRVWSNTWQSKAAFLTLLLALCAIAILTSLIQPALRVVLL